MARYDNLPVSVVKKGDDVYEIGVTINGQFFVFGGFKAGGFEADLAETELDPRAYVVQQQPTATQQAQQAAAGQQAQQVQQAPTTPQ